MNDVTNEKDDTKEIGAFDVARMERDILEAVYTLGGIDPGSPASAKLLERYGSEAPHRLHVVIESLVDEGLLIPRRSSDGSISRTRAITLIRGITPKGVRRLHEIQHPVRTWLKVNWFPMVVAVLATTVGIASIVSDWVRG